MKFIILRNKHCVYAAAECKNAGLAMHTIGAMFAVGNVLDHGSSRMKRAWEQG